MSIELNSTLRRLLDENYDYILQYMRANKRPPELYRLSRRMLKTCTKHGTTVRELINSDKRLVLLFVKDKYLVSVHETPEERKFLGLDEMDEELYKMLVAADSAP